MCDYGLSDDLICDADLNTWFDGGVVQDKCLPDFDPSVTSSKDESPWGKSCCHFLDIGGYNFYTQQNVKNY
jgi:hypothetical protein